MMIGLLKPDVGAKGGRILYRGESITDLDAEQLRQVRRRVAYVFQGGALFDSMNVLDNIGYAMREHMKSSEEAIEARAEQSLAMVGLDRQLLTSFPSSLSTGMRKRVALARSIAMEPDVILYDEPTTGLDPKNITRIGRMITKLQRELRVTSVVVTHDMPTAHKVSDRIAMLYQKKFPFVGTADEMWNSDRPEVRDFIHGHLRRAHGA
jgi:phospholipid/cholesterol/gamma-HCH transport system ATP-binding protein